MKTIPERIAYILKQKKLTANELSVMLNIQRSNISHLLNGRNKPSLDFIEKLHAVMPELSLSWLITGKGGAFAEPALKAPNESPIPQPESTPNESVEIGIPTHSGSNLLSLQMKPTRVLLVYGDDRFEYLTLLHK